MTISIAGLVAGTGGTHISWNVVDDLRQLLMFHFMVNALRAGTIVAIVAGTMGWFVVLRGQTFASHTLAMVGFPGAAGATLIGINAAFGFFGFCIAAAVAIAFAGGAATGSGSSDRHDESAVIATVQVVALGLGFLFVTLYKGLLEGINTLLFGAITGVSDSQVEILAAAAVACLGLLIVLGRPLLFSSIDPAVARANGVPTRVIAVGFFVMLGIAVAGTSQVTGTLLVFALLVTPAATAHVITARPSSGLVLSIALALAVTWSGEAFAYFSNYPVGFSVTSFALAGYMIARTTRSIVRVRC